MASILGLSIGHKIGRSAALPANEVLIEWLKIEGNYDRYRQPPSGLRKIDIAGHAAEYLSEHGPRSHYTALEAKRKMSHLVILSSSIISD